MARTKKKKVWVCFLGGVLKIHFVEASFPGLFDIPSFHKLEKNPDLTEGSASYKEWKEKITIGGQISDTNRSFRKLSTLPDSLWLTSIKSDLPKKSKYIFKITDGYIVCTEAVESILKNFNLGQTTLTPVKIHKLFTDELWMEDTFYFLNLCEWRQYLLPEQTHELIEFRKIKDDGIHSHKLSASYLKNNMVEVDSSALECDLDLWHDPALVGSFFMSDELKNALTEAGLDKLWKLHFCKLV